MAKKYSLKSVVKGGGELGREVFDFMQVLPQEIYHFRRLLKHGDFGINIRHEKMDKLINEIDRSSNDISFSLIIAALIVGSSLIIQLNNPPFILGYSALGMIGYVVATIFGLGLLISMISRGKI